jgi:DNA repair exonuclease SbcCD ATPase subunit
MLKKLKGLFIAEDEGDLQKALEQQAAQKDKTETAPTPPSANATYTSSTPTHSLPSNSGGEVDDKFVNILFEAMEKANIGGFDYIEYKQALRNLAKMPMDEATRFQSAYAAAQTMGATPPKLLESAQHYINVLSQEEQKFKAALSNQRSKQIGDKEQHIQNMAKIIQQKEQQIAQLTKDIENDKKNMETLKTEISEASVKMEKTQSDFIASFNALVGQIKSDAEKIKQYLS